MKFIHVNILQLPAFMLVLLLSLLSACGGGSEGGSATDDFPVDEAFAAALVSQGIPEDMARFFAAVKLTSNCPGTTTCTFVYSYPNGAKRELTLTETLNQQYTPTADELANTASVTYPVYDGKFAATGIDDSIPSVDTQIDISYFVPTSSIPSNLTPRAQTPLFTKAASSIVQFRDAGVNDGIQLDLSESGSKGADVAIGSLMEYFESLGKSVKVTGSIYSMASALSDIAGAAIISQQVQAWLSELDDLEKCASDPTNPVAQSDPNYTETTVANLRAIRAELKQISAVRFINAMGETGEGIHPTSAILSIPLKQAHSWTEQTLKDASEKLMQDARSSVDSCKPLCPTNFTATGKSESRIDVSWTASTVQSGINAVTSYILNGGNANGVSTADTMWPDIGLEKSTQYCYTISAHNEYGSSENCPQACGTTFGPPVVHSTGPINNATGVSVKTVVTATFSEEVDTATVTADGTFTLADGGGYVGGTVTNSGMTATFTPSGDLTYSTMYTATVTTAVKNLDGIAMEENYTWSFTTESAPVAGNLQFNYSPAPGFTISGSANVSWTIFENFVDVHSYVPSGTITADISVDGCDVLHATVPIQATVPHGPGPTMVVYTAANTAFPNSYIFGLAADPNVELTLMCGDPRTPVTSPLPLAFIVGPVCGTVPFTDEAQLAGTYSCPASGLSATWDFSQ